MKSLVRSLALLIILALAAAASGCDTLVGSKSDETTDEIFEEGRIDPTLVETVGYVPLVPFFEQGMAGPLQAPRDVYVGYDEFLYVVDEVGLQVLDLAGRPQAVVEIDEAASVVQDRRLHVYVTARRDTFLNGRTWNLPVVYRYSDLSTGAPRLEDIIWHPFDDDSRKFNRRDPIETDEEVEFTGVGVLPDNRIYVSRRGPVNSLSSAILPHNAVMMFSPYGINVQTMPLHPTRPSLGSVINPSDVLTFTHPPQRRSLPRSEDFIVAQTPEAEERLQYSLVSIRAVETSEGISYRPDNRLLVAALEDDTTKGDGYLYEENKFKEISDLAYAADETNYIFVLDAGTDSLFVFTSRGIEGVAPPPGAGTTKPAIVSFGGTGDGPLQFRNPQGVAYFDRIVYVADTDNDRISRFRLNTDFE